MDPDPAGRDAPRIADPCLLLAPAAGSCPHA